MRLGFLACLLTFGLVVPGGPAAADERPTAAEVVQDAIDDANWLVGWARRVGDPDLTASFERDRASLRGLRQDLRGDTTGPERRHARYVARSTIACSTDKGRYALRGPQRLQQLLAETSEARQVINDAWGPDLPEEVETLLDEADAQSAVATSRLSGIVTAAARVACDRPDASLVVAATRYHSALDAAIAGYSAALEAYELLDDTGDVIIIED